METASQTLFTEIFPVKLDTLPHIDSYTINVSGGEFSTIGGKLAYRLKRTFPGHWVWSSGRVLTDHPQSEENVMKVVQTLWTEQPDIFRGLRRVTQAPNWIASAEAQADFVARGLLEEVQANIRRILDGKRQDLGNAYVERICDIRGWVVQDQSAVSLSVSSRLVYKQDVSAYAKTVSERDLIGLDVADKTGTLKGEIVEIVGPLSDERNRLMSFNPREEMQRIISDAPDDELVVKVSTGYGHPYDYVVSALRIVLDMEHLAHFNIDSRKVLEVMRLEPAVRAKIIAEVSKEITKQHVSRAYNSDQMSSFFMTTPYATQVRVGNGKTIPYDDKTLLSNLQTNGLFRVAEKFQGGTPIRVAFLINSAVSNYYDDFWTQIEGKLRALRFGIQKVGQIQIQGSGRAQIERAVIELENSSPDIILAFFADQFDDDENDEESAYFHFKSLTIGRGIPSQVIEKSTLKNKYAVGNIVMGILGKTGNIPYVLDHPLEYADVIVGIDIARERKKRLQGSVNATAVARIYLNSGEFLQYAIHDAPLEGETIPPSVLQSLFPVREFSGKRVIIHRDGYFRGDEKQALTSWAKELKATFHLVQVIKSGSPRIYAQTSGEIQQPLKGSAFLVSDTEALLVSTLPPFKNATPRPLRILVEPPFPITEALNSVLAMTTLHYGSLRPPRLPVTIHYSDKIAYMALRGIKPKHLEGNIPYWL